MAYFCIDPDDGSDVTGASGGTAAIAAATPYATLAAITLSDGDTLLAKRGTTAVGVVVADAISISIDAYYNSDGTDNSAIAKPIIDGNSASSAMIWVKNHPASFSINNIQLQNILSQSGTQYALVNLEMVQDIEVTNCDFKGANYRGLQAYIGGISDTTNYGCSSLVIEDNTFTDFYRESSETVDDSREAIRLNLRSNVTYTGDGSDGQLSGMELHRNTFDRCGTAFRIVYTDPDTIVAAGLWPYDMRYSYNVFTDCYRALNGICWQDTGINYCNYNTLTNIGPQYALNALQTLYCVGGEIRGNTVAGCTGLGAGDGHCLILDWAYSTAPTDYHTTGVLVTENDLSGANGTTNSSGINIWAGLSNTIVGNYIHDNDYGVVANRSEATGHVLKSNTIVNNTESGFLSKLSAPEVTFQSNIIGGSTIGFEVDGGTDPAETYNCVYDVDSNDVTLDATDITDDALLGSSGKLTPSSPCVGTGVKWWGTAARPVGFDGEPFSDIDMDIGGQQSKFSPLHPGYTGVKPSVGTGLGENLVTNGDFTTDTTGWTGYNSATLAIVSGEMSVTNGAASGGRCSQQLTLVEGATYLINADFSKQAAINGKLNVGTSNFDSSALTITFTSSQSYEATFVALSANWVTLTSTSTTLGAETRWDNVSVRRVL